jgi:hypothetical protein
MVSAESGGRLITWEVSTYKLIYLVSETDGEIHHLIVHSNNRQFIVFSRAPTSSQTTCTCRLFATDEILFQFTYKAPDGPIFYKDGILTMDESVLVVAAMGESNVSSNELDQKAATEYFLKLFDSQNGMHLYDIALRYSNFRPFSSMVRLQADYAHQHFVAVIDDDKGNILDVHKRSGEFIHNIGLTNAWPAAACKQPAFVQRCLKSLLRLMNQN